MCAASRRAMGLARIALLSSLAAAFPAAAEPAPAAPEAQREWTLIVSPYLWATSLNGDASVMGVPARVDLPFSKSLKNLDFAAMGEVEIASGRFGAYFNGQYANLSSDQTIRSIGIGADMKSTMLTAGAYYRVHEASLGGDTVFGSPRRFVVEPTIGVRWTRLRAGLKGAGHAISATESWADPFVGARIGIDLSDRWQLAMEGDVGGFGAGSRRSFNGQAYLGYRTKILGYNSIIRAGYRALYQDYREDDFRWKVTQRGPVFGVSVAF